MTSFDHDWDSLPGESSSAIVDIESTVRRMVKGIDDGDRTYGLAEIRTDLDEVRRLAERSIADIDKGAG